MPDVGRSTAPAFASMVMSFNDIYHGASDIFLMNVEIEKKYRLTKVERETLLKLLQESDAQFCGEEIEENTLFAGGNIDFNNCVLRLRRVGDAAILTYKERLPSSSSIKQQREDETLVEDPDAMTSILEELGYRPAIVYEKRRATWRFAETEVVVDELPFGFFAEIEGEEQAILNVERILGLSDLAAEMATYPQLAAQHGKKVGKMTESRF